MVSGYEQGQVSGFLQPVAKEHASVSAYGISNSRVSFSFWHRSTARWQASEIRRSLDRGSA